MMSLQIQSGIDLQSFLLFIQVNKSILVYLYNYFISLKQLGNKKSCRKRKRQVQ